MKNIRTRLLLTWLLGILGSTSGVVAAPVSTGISDKNMATPANSLPKEQNRVKGNPGAKMEDTSLERININIATAEQLAKSLNGIGIKKAEAIVKSLNGIGIKKAEAIVRYREQYGAFTELDQLREVSGIGPVFLQQNSAKLTL
ncbi:ComEA family DNA-binding protein [Candidatus Fukatsuia endosymbiont of Drepanosiphum platanoidis]|uniref:ComEA family DNA-binding protein n=1 Tax=Candidatus Fukatsuia endosymbiont of Drepanosiphum platanoidis TaxID=3077953 RepID=UPI00313F3912